MSWSRRIAGNQRPAEDQPSLTEGERILIAGGVGHELLLPIDKNIPQRAQRAVGIEHAALKRNRGIATGVVEEVSRQEKSFLCCNLATGTAA